MASGNGSEAGASAYIKSFELRAARKDDMPVKRARKAAFAAVAPKKQPAKLQFSSSNVGKTSGAKVQGKEEESATKDGKLQVWLKAGNADRPGCEEARDYLLKGIPYRGSHARNTKEAVKEQGAVWMKNPLKINEERDGITPGWFVAHTEKALIDLIRMPRIKKERPPWMTAKYKSEEETQPQWVPLDVPEKSHNTIVLLILEFEAFEQEKFELQTKALTKARNAKEEAKLNSQKHHDMPPDLPADIAMMKERWGIKWTEDMADASGRCPALGPSTGISCVRRAHRGLHLKVCTIGEVTSGVYLSNATVLRKQNLAGVAGSISSNVPDFIDYTQMKITSASSGCYMFGKGPGMIPVPTEWQQLPIRDASEAVEHARVVNRGGGGNAVPDNTWCVSCVSCIMEQFNDCSCMNPCIEWNWCGLCHCAWHEGQDCSCKSADEWQRRQSKCVAENERRTEKAERDTQLAIAMAGGVSVPVARSDASDCAPEEEPGMGETLDDMWGR